MILSFWDGCTKTNELILFYKKSVGIDKWLKSCEDQYLMVVMIIVMT